jgi:hypothetical protein
MKDTELWLDRQTGSSPFEHIRQKALLSDRPAELPALRRSIYLSYVGSVTPTNFAAALTSHGEVYARVADFLGGDAKL